MMRSRRWARTLPAAVLLGVAVVGAERPAVAQAAASPPAQAYPGRYPYTEADVQFVTGMISHHAQAIVMAGWAPTHDAGRSIRVLNIDARDAGTNDFLEAAGATEIVQQFEMNKRIG